MIRGRTVLCPSVVPYPPHREGLNPQFGVGIDVLIFDRTAVLQIAAVFSIIIRHVAAIGDSV